MIAPARPPLAAPTIAASAVAMKRALPSPQTPRKDTISAIDPDAPAAALKATIRSRPAISVRFAPILLDTQPVMSIETPVIAK